MANIGTFTAQDNGYSGTVRTLTLNVKVKFLLSEKDSDKLPDYRIVVGGYEIVPTSRPRSTIRGFRRPSTRG